VLFAPFVDILGFNLIKRSENSMEITGKVHCFFEQSGTFKNEFIKLGIPAEDYDIQNNFGETDNVLDLFAEIEKGYENKPSIFDSITPNDLIMAFFPCIYFSCLSQMAFRFTYRNYQKISDKQKVEEILKRTEMRAYYYKLLLKFVGVCIKKNLRMVFENPYSTDHYLKANFIKEPDVIDSNRMLRGDYFVKPTGYWFFNCSPTQGYSLQKDKQKKRLMWCKKAPQAGLCSEERSMISPDYARNFICDFVIGKEQENTLLTLF
jgi:hypothetical protein